MKILSTILSLVLLLSSMNLSVMRHFCGGRVAEVRLAILGEASCGMDATMCSVNTHCDAAQSISKKPCCEDELTQISVDDYKPATNIAVANLALLLIAAQTDTLFFPADGHISPRRNYKAPPDCHSVSLTFLQVFRV